MHLMNSIQTSGALYYIYLYVNKYMYICIPVGGLLRQLVLPLPLKLTTMKWS